MKAITNFLLTTLALFLVFFAFCLLCDFFLQHPIILAVVCVAGFLALLYHEDVLARE